MALFQLREGKIYLPTIGKEYYSRVHSNGNFAYARFPFCAPSMKRLEECIQKKHIISFLSKKGLPLTNHELVYLCRPSTMSGTIYSHQVKDLKYKHDCFLNTDEVQMLITILLCNRFIYQQVHVLCPQTCQKIMDAYESLKDGKQEKIQEAMHDIHKYVDSIHDILEHKYLAFLFNTGEAHWVTMVVVNPSAIFTESTVSGTDGTGQEVAVGWFFLDSSGDAETSTRMV